MKHTLDGQESTKPINQKLFNHELEKGLHIIIFYASDTDHIESFYITVAVMSKQVKEDYKKIHAKGLINCPNQGLPMALENDRSVSVSKEEQTLYNYPHIRVP